MRRTEPVPGKHAGTIRRLRHQIELSMPMDLGAYAMSSIAMPGAPDDSWTPDLVVLPDPWEVDDGWLSDPGDVELAVEVISKSEEAKQITQKNDWYASAGVRTLLVLDPRKGVWALYTRPKEGSYHGCLHGDYGEDIPLAEPFGFSIDTRTLPLYGDVAHTRWHSQTSVMPVHDCRSTAAPVVNGARRKAQSVLLSVETLEALSGQATRGAAVASADGSIEAEGLRTSEAADRDAEAYVRGDLDADALVARAVIRYQHTAGRVSAPVNELAPGGGGL